MEAGESSMGMRALYIIFGLLAIILGILVFVYPGLGFAIILTLFGVGLLFVAIFAIVMAAQGEYPTWLRALGLIIGLLVIGLVIAIIVVPNLGLFLQILLVGLGLILLGIQAIAFPGTDKNLAGWARGLSIVLGIIAVILGIVMIISFDVGEAVLIIYLGLGLFVVGIGAVVSGASG